jgi:hypothetical protein
MIAGDRDILKQVSEYRFVRPEDLHELTARHIVAIRRRLCALEESNYVKRVRANGSSVFYLSGKGASVFGVSFSQNKSPFRVEHDLIITRFHLDIRAKCVFWEQHQGELKDDLINPDAFFSLQFGELTYSYFLEVEVSRETGYENGESALIRKMRDYNQYYLERRHEKWNIPNFRVVILMPTQARAKNFREKLAAVLLFKRYWIASMDYTDVFGTIFMNPADEELSAFPE